MARKLRLLKLVAVVGNDKDPGEGRGSEGRGSLEQNVVLAPLFVNVDH